MKKLTDNKLFLFGGIGTAITALCCFTPLLVWGLTAIGAAAIIAYLDFVLIPLLLLFAGITLIGVQQYRRRNSQ